MHLSDTSSIAQHLKKHSCPTTQLRKILTDNTTILEHQNNKQKLQILEALYIRNLQPALNRINFQTSANVLKFERIQKRICRHKMSIMFNEICINEEMLPKYTYIYIYLRITMIRKSSKYLHVTYGALNSCFDLIRSH